MTGASGDASVPVNTAAPRHIPVLRGEALDGLALKPGGLYLDGTFGAGGYTRAILEAFPDTRVIAIDRDPEAIAAGQMLVAAYPGRLVLVHGQFGDLDEIVAENSDGLLDGVVLDIGVSSMQIDEAIRGFSFRNDGPLDMRMSSEGRSAADIVNEADDGELADIIYHYGEDRKSRAIARAIVAARADQPIVTTKRLADIISKVVWAKPHEIHPATRTFQALRIAVNDELGELVKALHAAERVLKPGGRLSVVSFHSLEDRIVKVFLAARSGKNSGSRHMPTPVGDAPTFLIEGKWPVAASDTEISENSRARSAKLRVGIRRDSPACKADASVMKLSTLPPVKRGRR